MNEKCCTVCSTVSDATMASSLLVSHLIYIITSSHCSSGISLYHLA